VARLVRGRVTSPDLDPAPLRRLLAETPDLALGWLRLGLVQAAVDAIAASIAPLSRAAAVAPRTPAPWESLGMAQARLGRWQDSAQAWTRAVALRPGRSESHASLARVLMQAGEPDSADAAYATALLLSPADARLGVERALAWAEAGQRGRGDGYRRALSLAPDLPPAWVNLGAQRWRLSDSSGAEAAWRRAIAAGPDLADAHNNLGTAEQKAGRLPQAARSYRRGLALAPARPDAWFNLGSALQTQNQADGAIPAYERALVLRPDFLDALIPLATLYNFLGLLDLATAANRHIVRLRPGQPEASRALLAGLIFDPTMDGAAIRRVREDWCRANLPQVSVTRFERARDPERVLRIGVVGGANLRGNTHAFVALPGFEGLDRADHRLEVTVYSDLPADREDGYTRRYRQASDRWRMTERLDDAALARAIRQDEIDVLLDVVGHLGGPRFPAVAMRPAPVQIMDLALGTSGSQEADWIVGDPLLTPPEHEAHFTERVLRLPLAYCYDPLVDLPEVGPLPATGDRHVTFGSTNALVKITPATVALWSRVLRAVPQARLVLKGRGFSDARVRAHFARAFDRQGIAATRIDLKPWTTGFLDHLSFLNEIDIALDPVPYGGVTTTCEALWMGVPVVTLAGDRMAGRYSQSLLAAVGLREGIAESEAAYVAHAVAMAVDFDGLAGLRSGLRAQAQASALADRRAYGDARGRAFRAAWRDWCAA
jgi:protein O-GlcNAc transferase